jgi:hypothetical protein
MFVWLIAIKPKSITHAFDRLVSEAGIAFCSRAAFAFFASFSLEVFFVKPLYVFGSASFFIGALFVKPLHVFGVPLFLSEVFLLSQ